MIPRLNFFSDTLFGDLASEDIGGISDIYQAAQI